MALQTRLNRAKKAADLSGGLRVILSDILLDSSLTCWGSDSKAGMQTGRVVYHIKCGRCNYSEKGRHRRPLHHPAAQSELIKAAFCQRQHSVRAWAAGKQIWQGQQVLAPTFYKLQLVVSTQCNVQPPSPSPCHPTLPSHVLPRWSAVSGQQDPPPQVYSLTSEETRSSLIVTEQSQNCKVVHASGFDHCC